MASALSTRAPHVRRAAGALALLAVVALAHGGALGHGFVHFDDDVYVYANPQVLAGLTLDGLRWALALDAGQTYFHPVTWLSLMADAALLGGRAWSFHLVNLLLHGLNALLLLSLLRRVTRREGPALATALLWAVHPLTVEAVAWITERKTVLSTALGLLAMLTWTGGARPRSRARAAAGAALLAAGLLAKPGLVVLPALLLLVEASSPGAADATSTPGHDAEAPGATWLRRLASLWPLLLVSAVGLALALLSAGRIPPESSQVRPLALRLAHAVASLPTYLAVAAWPEGLAVYHPYPAAVEAGPLALGAGLLLAATVGALALRRRWPAALLGWGWFLVALAPYFGLAQAGLWPGWAERFTYLPLMGLSVLVAFGAADLLARLGAPRLVGPLAVGLALAALVTATRHQVEAWRDSVTLFTRSVAAEPGAAVLQANLGIALLDAGRPALAERALAEAVRLNPRYPNGQAALGLAQYAQGRPQEAVGHFLAALADAPDHPDALFGCAEALREAGRPDQARVFYQRFLAVVPAPAADRRATAERYAR